MSKENGLSMLDANQVIQDVHNEAAHALDVISVNELIPVKFAKIDLTYITSGFGIGEVGEALYYSNGEKQQQTITCRNDELGTAHKTSISFYNRTPTSLDSKYFVIFDDVGPVGVFFNLNGASTLPIDPTVYRFITVNIVSSDSEITIANKLVTAVNSDSKFFAIGNQAFSVISNRKVGARTDSYDVSTALYLKNSKGVDSNTLNSTFFYINAPLDTVQYYVWFNVGGTGVNPSISGKTGIQVALTAGATANQVANALGSALSTLFLTNISDSKLTVTNLLIGVTTRIQDVSVNFTSVTLDVAGENRNLVAHLILTYNSNNDLASVERI